MEIRQWIQKRRPRAGLAVFSYALALALNFWTYGNPLPMFGIIIVAISINLWLFWPELRLLQLRSPKDTHTESPGWLYIFGVAAVTMAAFGCFSLYWSASQRPSLLSDAEFSQPYIHGKHIKLDQLVDENNMVHGRTFEDCWIYGPVVLAIHGRVAIGDSYLGDERKAFLVVLPNDVYGPGTGVIALEDCTFKRCHFFHVSFSGTQEQIDYIKQSARSSH